MFVVGSAQEIPWEENSFDKVLSVESFYYYGNQEGALDELLRVMAPGGELYILINLDSTIITPCAGSHELQVPVQVPLRAGIPGHDEGAWLR